MLLLLFALSFTWKVQLNQDSVQQEARLWGSWMEQISLSQINPPPPTFTSSLDGTILSSHPLWLEAWISTSANSGSHSHCRTINFFLDSLQNLDSKQPSVYVVSRTPNGREYRFLPFPCSATAEGLEFCSAERTEHRDLYNFPPNLETRICHFGLVWALNDDPGGRLMLVSTQTLLIPQGLQLAVATDFTITFAVLALISFSSRGSSEWQDPGLVPLLNEQKAFSAQLDQAVNQLHDAVSPVTPTK